jgi:cytoskeletal protein RodZ
MNRNQKIALGCGGAGCLGLIVVVIAGCVIYFVFYNQSRRYSASNYNFNSNTNSNSNSNDSNDNSDFNSNANANSNSSSSSTSSFSDDDKHKLYQAAGMTGDAEVIRRVSVKIGLMDEDYTPGANYEQFVRDHIGWAIRNTDFIQTVNTAEKARAYINEHLE